MANTERWGGRIDVDESHAHMGRDTIAVLGAGVAGLVAAYELEQLGHDVVVLEADSRIGGRIFTHRFAGPGGPAVELGAMRIPANHKLTLRYVEKLGLKHRLRPFKNILSDPDNYLRVGAKFVRVGNSSDALIRDTRRYSNGVPRRAETLLFVGWLQALVRALAPKELRELARADIAKMLGLADELDLAPFVHQHGVDLGAAFGKHPELRAACSSRLESFLDDIVRESGADMLCLSGGMDQLTYAVAARLHSPIRTRHAVTGIAVQRDGVTLTFDHERARSRITYPVVLCTIPFSVLRRVSLTGVDVDKLDVIETLDYGSATKVGLHCRDAFWTRAGIAGGGSSPGGRVRQIYYPAQESDPALGAALLGSYTIAEDADVLGRLPEDDRHRAVVDELTALHPELAEPGVIWDAASVAWGARRWNRGCAARRWGLTDVELDREVNRAVRPQGRLFFAGEHCLRTTAWINAAIESALASVAQIDAFVLRTSNRRSDVEEPA